MTEWEWESERLKGREIDRVRDTDTKDKERENEKVRERERGIEKERWGKKKRVWCGFSQKPTDCARGELSHLHVRHFSAAFGWMSSHGQAQSIQYHHATLPFTSTQETPGYIQGVSLKSIAGKIYAQIYALCKKKLVRRLLCSLFFNPRFQSIYEFHCL